MTARKEVEEKYRSLFCSSPMGQDVLGDILKSCHFGTTLNWENPGQIAEYNVGILILAKCGILRSDNFTEVMRALCSVSSPFVK